MPVRHFGGAWVVSEHRQKCRLEAQLGPKRGLIERVCAQISQPAWRIETKLALTCSGLLGAETPTNLELQIVSQK